MSKINIDSVKKDCHSNLGIILNQNNLIQNSDGTLSAFLNNPGGKIPYQITKTCCKVFADVSDKAYYYDLNSQKCRWRVSSEHNTDIEPIKITLNTKGHDGTIFNVDKHENCSLEVNFEYLFKINCKSLAELLTTDFTYDSKLYNDIKTLKNSVDGQKIICEDISVNIDATWKSFNETDYSIECSSFPIYNSNDEIKVKEVNPIAKMTDKSKAPFSKTAFGGGLAPFSMPVINYGLKTFSITDKGLIVWKDIIGVNNYNNFIQGNPDSYTCDDVVKLYNINQEIPLARLAGDKLLYESSTPFGTKTKLKIEYDSLVNRKQTCNTEFIRLQGELNKLLDIKSAQQLRCGTPVDVLENLDVSMSIDVIQDNGYLKSVYTHSLLSSIGVGNLYQYLKNNSYQSGFYVCGEPNKSESWLSGCTNLFFEELGEHKKPELNEPNASSCLNVKNSILNGLYAESGLKDIKTFTGSLNPNILSSKWLKYNEVITDSSVINQIKNKKIKLSLNINSTCGDFSLLVDQISLDKVCNKTNTTSMFVTQSPGFQLSRVIDNKKSWGEDDFFVHRNFGIEDSDRRNEIRQTDYFLEDERLIINSKEIDLDINSSLAVENDLWFYIKDNIDILNSYEGVNFNNLFNTNISKLNNFNLFKEVISSELIDVKNRKTISSYATLKGLYDRYLNSDKYSNIKSSGFDYYSMEQFVDLIGNYWVDLIEQVIPATTIWGSVKIYTNTVFDQQKFKYKKYSSLLSSNEFTNTNVLSPVKMQMNDKISLSSSVINLVNESGLPQKSTVSVSDNLYIVQMNSGSEFIGSIRNYVDCDISDWVDLTPCNGGYKTRSRTIANTNGIGCTTISESVKCVVNCEVSQWGAWGSCSADGTKSRTRRIITQPLNGGIGCPVLTQTTNCLRDANVSEWSAWSVCSAQGTKTRTRIIINQPMNGGMTPILSETVLCDIDCQVSEWSAWSQCFNDGTKTRTRTILTQPVNRGAGCPVLREKNYCAFNCEVTPWSEWSICTSEGIKTRTRKIIAPALNGGTGCPILVENINCSFNAIVSEWGVWGECDSIMGTKSRERTIINPPMNGGIIPVLTESVSCAVNAKVSQWSEWSACDVNTGLKIRTRTIISFALNGGQIPPLEEIAICPVGCKLSDFGEWTDCNKKIGTKSRTRMLLKPALNGGECPSLQEVVNCNEKIKP